MGVGLGYRAFQKVGRNKPTNPPSPLCKRGISGEASRNCPGAYAGNARERACSGLRRCCLAHPFEVLMKTAFQCVFHGRGDLFYGSGFRVDKALKSWVILPLELIAV